MRQRIGIARALLNDPVVVFLDEPTLGLDPRGQQELLDLIQHIARERGTGVVLCSHMLSEIESICDDVVILNLGQIVARGTVAEVIGRTQQNLVLDSALRIRVPAEFVAKAKQVLTSSMPAVLNVSPIGNEGSLRVDIVDFANGNTEAAYLINNSILSALIRAKIPILSFEAEGARLQDVFLHLTEAMQ
jgi:ABC-2 type transport system ATP-binding protein